jgi:hypothetical protein
LALASVAPTALVRERGGGVDVSLSELADGERGDEDFDFHFEDGRDGVCWQGDYFCSTVTLTILPAKELGGPGL